MAHTPPENQEIDLTKVARSVRASFSRANDSIFDGILFIKRNIVIFIILIIVGAALGFYLDSSSKSYEHKVNVIPNFQSVDYLYSEIDLLNAKLRENDSAFFKKAGIKNFKNLSKVEIEPIVDIYQFIDNSDEKRLALFKILAENGDLKKILEENTTSKNYKSHLITFTTKKVSQQSELIDPIMEHFNNSTYFDTIKRQSIESQIEKISSTDSIIAQIDNILNDYSKSSGSGNSNLVYYKDNTDLNEIINIKSYMVREQAKNRIDLINFQKTVKDSSVIMNIKNYSALTGRMKVIVPVIFILLFVFFRMFVSYYKNQTYKRSLIN
ncbi:MAG: hypothetical protein EOO45_18545 [Flavobacterium sp.]|nr:MAG: hypothetical protein EOO45_18545 [Flavobacterium sp.]